MKHECTVHHCTGKADETERCWKHRRRKDPIPQRNEKRMRARFKRTHGPQAALCRELPCWACGVPGKSEAHHWPTVARGGTDADTLPLCPDCHTLGGYPRAFHSTPVTEWEGHHGVSVEIGIRMTRAAVAKTSTGDGAR